MVHGLMTTSPSPSQLLRDLDSCNSDPVAVASCFVERVRTAGSWPHPALLGASLQGKCWVPCLEYQGHLGWRWGCWVDGMSETDGYRDESADAWGECVPGPRGMPLLHPGLQANASFPEITVFGLSLEPRV